MSFEKLAQKLKAEPAALAHDKARAAEQRRKAWHEGFLALVYPHWQGPLVKMAHKAGIESAVGGVAHGLPPQAGEVAKTLPQVDWAISELITVTASVGVGAQVAYVFAGDENDGTLARLVALRDGDAATFLAEHTKLWTGPLQRLLDAAEADIPGAAELFGPLVLEAYEAKVQRLAIEEQDRRAADKKAAEEAAAEESEAAAQRRKLQEAALVESRRLEAEQAAKE